MNNVEHFVKFYQSGNMKFFLHQIFIIRIEMFYQTTVLFRIKNQMDQPRPDRI